MTIFDVVASNMLVALESGSASAVTAADWASVISAMTAQISVATIVGVMATIVAFVVVFFFGGYIVKVFCNAAFGGRFKL